MAKWSLVGVVLLLGAATLVAGEPRNLMPDALTRATTWNQYTGDIEAFSDGEYPGNSVSPRSFAWPSKGVLVMEFGDPVELSELRAYMGDRSGSHTVSLYLGGRRQDDGGGRNPEGQLMLEFGDTSYLTNGWLSIPLLEGVPVDNVELTTFGRSVFYEIELLGAGGTSIRPATWGAVKGRFGDAH